MYLIEGKITDLHRSYSRTNLIKKLKANSTTQNLVGGIVGAIADSPALVSNAAILESYEGEMTVNFGCQIGGQVVVGAFAGAQLLKNGDYVKAVVRNEGDALYVDAIIRPEDKLLWLPVGVRMGTIAQSMSTSRHVMWQLLFVLIIFLPVTMYYGFKEAGSMLVLIMFTGMIISTIVGYTINRELHPLAAEAEKIFTTLGFPDPARLDMSPGSYPVHHGHFGEDDGEESLFYYQDVIDAYVNKTKVVISAPSMWKPELPPTEALRELESTFDERWEKNVAAKKAAERAKKEAGKASPPQQKKRTTKKKKPDNTNSV